MYSAAWRPAVFQTNQNTAAAPITAPLSSTASTGKPERAIPADAWKAPYESTIPAGKAGDMIRYGKELIAHTVCLMVQSIIENAWLG